MRRLSAFLTVLALVALVTKGASQEQGSTPTASLDAVKSFSVATYNVLYRNPDLAALVTTIRQADVDLVALQETNADSERYLRGQLAGQYPHILFRPSKGRSEGFGFLSRVPLSAPEFLGADPDGRGGWTVEAHLGGKQVRVISVHLATPRVIGARTPTEILKAFAECEQVHRQEVTPILAKIRPDLPTIVLGDFNSFSFGVAVTSLLGRGLVDSFAAVTPDAEQHGTWTPSGGLSGQKFPIRIDYVLHDHSFKTLSSRILRGPASDHALLLSRLEFGASGRK